MYSSTLWAILALCVHLADTTERDLTQRLLQDYVTSARPVKDVSRKSLKIFFHIL